MPENALHKTDLKSFYTLASARSGHACALAAICSTTNRQRAWKQASNSTTSCQAVRHAKDAAAAALSGFSAATAFALHANFADEYVATRRNRQLLQVSAGRIKKRVRTSITMSSP
jgi:hypothetical protein